MKLSLPHDHTLSSSAVAFLQRTQNLLIGGEWTAPVNGRRIPVTDPASGETVTDIAAADAQDVDRAVEAAKAAFDNPDWRQMRPSARERLIHRLADIIERNIGWLAEIECLDNGKSCKLAQNVDIRGGVDFLRYMAGWPSKIIGNTIPVSFPLPRDGDYTAWTRREPVGVVAAIVPWNFPLLMALWKIGPALAAGCTVVLKPAEDTSLTTLALGQLAIEAGLPPGVINVITGLGHDAGAALASHPGVSKIAFTGSTVVGQQVGHAAMENMTRLTLELGGKSPAIILPDAPVKRVVRGASNAIFYNQGQVCCAASRLYVHQSRFDEITEAIAAAAGNINLGSGFNEDALMGPLVSEKQRKRVAGMVERARQGGAEILAGGASVDGKGWFYKPTVLAGLRPDMEIVREEVFGPVLSCLPFDDIDEVVAAANGTNYGLAASVWSNDLSAVHRLIPRLRAGTVWVNCHNLIDPALPFGGVGFSGLGREMGADAVEQYTEVKSVCMLS